MEGGYSPMNGAKSTGCLVCASITLSQAGILYARHSSGIEIFSYLFNFQCGGFPLDIMATGT
jgi:hypothetical protein